MTITLGQLGLYAAALAVLFLTPGPVWVALVARGMSGGFGAAWPLALGVVVGDMIWPLLAIFGVSYIVSIYGDFLLLLLLRWGAVVMFAVMGFLLIRHADRSLSNDPRLTRPGNWAGFAAGLMVIAGNPKAILFYMGLLPGFFDLPRFTGADIAAIVFLSALVPLLGNLVLALFVDRIRRFLSSPGALRRANIGAGIALIGVAAVIALIGA